MEPSTPGEEGAPIPEPRRRLIRPRNLDAGADVPRARLELELEEEPRERRVAPGFGHPLARQRQLRRARDEELVAEVGGDDLLRVALEEVVDAGPVGEVRVLVAEVRA